MEFEFLTQDSAVPCLITADKDNGRYMVRKPDTSGEVFNNKEELVQWLKKNWVKNHILDEALFSKMMTSLKEE
ncbi:hypothetical protein [Heyndrickxia acidicola]|uniref:Threonine dehydratase n=1 Tax=Heyndrickxia acidicola TaxID=209389 RepID=A0ABU6MH23_9BACI|nr:hypothetical protein [Heyndrickxia acidicola]MED1203978.1 hypothetical protein [Heyndrickxia acidicola]